MNYKKLPFKEYTVMSNNLIQNLHCQDVYRAYVLLLTTDKKTLKTDTTLEQLARFVGESLHNYKKGSGSNSFNDKLKATGEIDIHDINSKRNDRHWTSYTFKQVTNCNYRRISREFYDNYSSLDLKLRGFILKLFCAAEPHSYIIKLSMRKLVKLTHMGHSTIATYINKLKDLDLLDEIGDSKLLKVKGLLVDLPKNEFVEEVIKDFDHMIEFNESRGNPISRECLIYKKYKKDGFKDIVNMNAFAKSIRFGFIGRDNKIEKVEYPDFIL